MFELMKEYNLTWLGKIWFVVCYTIGWIGGFFRGIYEGLTGKVQQNG